jgi:hypothetical protein
VHDANEDGVMVVGCIECRLGFESFDDAADHVDAVHPHADYREILVSLLDDDEAEAEPDLAPSPTSWRCKVCPETFTDYELAVQHADQAHPDRVTVDPRAVVEAVSAGIARIAASRHAALIASACAAVGRSAPAPSRMTLPLDFVPRMIRGDALAASSSVMRAE